LGFYQWFWLWKRSAILNDSTFIWSMEAREGPLGGSWVKGQVSNTAWQAFEIGTRKEMEIQLRGPPFLLCCGFFRGSDYVIKC
jgi:hypothetical protein